MDKELTNEQKAETLEPYEGLIERVLDQYQLPTEEDKPQEMKEEILEMDSSMDDQETLMNNTID